MMTTERVIERVWVVVSEIEFDGDVEREEWRERERGRERGRERVWRGTNSIRWITTRRRERRMFLVGETRETRKESIEEREKERWRDSFRHRIDT
jgi:hypothetical protein